LAFTKIDTIKGKRLVKPDDKIVVRGKICTFLSLNRSWGYFIKNLVFLLSINNVKKYHA